MAEQVGSVSVNIYTAHKDKICRSVCSIYTQRLKECLWCRQLTFLENGEGIRHVNPEEKETWGRVGSESLQRLGTWPVEEQGDWKGPPPVSVWRQLWAPLEHTWVNHLTHLTMKEVGAHGPLEKPQ